jgi:hypothetical protein
MLAVSLKCGLLLPSQCRPIDTSPTFGCERLQCGGELPDSVEPLGLNDRFKVARRKPRAIDADLTA